MRVDLLEWDSPRWADQIAGLRHDFYHLPSYVAFAARRQDVGQPLAFVAEEDDHRFFVPIIVRPIPAEIAGDRELYDATCPRGYPGPLVWPAEPKAGFVDRAVRALIETLRKRSTIAAFVRVHPLLQPPLAELARSGSVVVHGDSVSIDLGRSQEELWRQMRENHRRDISRAVRLGYAARIDEAWQRWDGFVDVYAQSMNRLGAGAAWHLSYEYLDDLRQSLGERLHLGVVEFEDRLAAAALLTEVDGIVEYHLAGTANEFLTASPSKVLIAHARTWAKARGNRVLHLAGSTRQGDALYRFKAGFSTLSHPVHSWRIVVDPPAYSSLVRQWERENGVAADSTEGYFPAYRRPPSDGTHE